MENKLVLLIDNELITGKRLKEIYEQWGHKQADIIHLKEWEENAGNTTSLFLNHIVHLDLSDKTDLNNFKKLIEKDKKHTFFKEKWYGNGLIITTPHTQGTSKIINLVKQHNGTIEAKIDGNAIQEILTHYQLPFDTIQAIIAFIGEDFEKFSVIDTSLKTLSDEKRKSLSIEEVYSYLPKKPGSVKPWVAFDYLFATDIDNAISYLRRILETQHELVVISLLRPKVVQLFQYTIMKELGIINIQDMATKLGYSNKWTFLSLHKANMKVSPKVAERILKLVLYTEETLKGTRTTMNTRMELEELFTKIVLLLKGAWI